MIQLGKTITTILLHIEKAQCFLNNKDRKEIYVLKRFCILFIVYMCVKMCMFLVSIYVEVRGQLNGVGPLFKPCG